MLIAMRKFLSVMLVLFLVACNQKKNNIFDAPVWTDDAFESRTVSGTLVDLGEDKPIGISGIFLCDSIMLMKASVRDFPQQIHAFSLSDNSLKGRYVAKGRGDKELLIPIIKDRFFPEEQSVYIFDLSKCCSYALDLRESVASHSTDLAQLIKLPSGTLDSYPYNGSHLAFIPQAEDYVCTVLDKNGHQEKHISLFPGVSGIDYFDRLSSACAVNHTVGHLVMAMCMLPQINILDLETGGKKTVAVSKEYRNWERIFSEGTDNRNIYYTSITKSENGFMALYSGSTFEEWVKGKDHPHIHIFDWNGNLLYDISIAEQLKTIAFDDSTKQLYGVDSNDEIYRYDLTEGVM